MKKIKKYKKKITVTRLSHESDPLSLYNRGVILFDNRQYDEAIILFQKALELNPDLIHAYNYLGNAFQEKKQFDEAITCYQKAIQVSPVDPTAYINLGIAFQNTLHHEKAVEYFNAALRLNPNLYQAYDCMGLSMALEGNMEKALESYRASLSINPDSEMTLVNLGNLIAQQGKLDEAGEYYQRAVQVNPNNFQANQALLMNMLYNPRDDQQAIYSAHLRVAKKFAEPLSVLISPHVNERTVSRRLRIGYVSPDFKRHSVSYFIEPVLAAHNRDDFEVFCYASGDRYDEVTERIKSSADHWREISSISDETAGQEIRRDGIDILVDLVGHTANNRILLFARRPAPVQLTWIGYPATTGLTAMDYKIVDYYTDPPGLTEQFYSENLIRLPESFICYFPDRESPDVGPLPALSAGHITFGSFNNFQKVTPHALELWAKILGAVPGSSLTLKSRIFSDRNTCRYIMDMFMRRGITEDRITLLSWISSVREHLTLYSKIDIGFDTFPYNGTTTTCEAVWMGVPVITLAGNTHASRVGVSILSNAGLVELIARTPDEYVSKAVNLAHDLKRLRLLREDLRGMLKNSPVIDAKSFTVNLERCYRQIWEQWCNSDFR